MKKSCDECMALTEITHSYSCSLGFKMSTNSIGGVTAKVFPLEQCPKPTTNKKLSDLQQWKLKYPQLTNEEILALSKGV